MATRSSQSGQEAQFSHDKQIEYLQSQVQTYKARSSLLLQQLFSALDALDDAAKTFEETLERERDAKEGAHSKIRTLQKRIRELERDNDDLKAAVLELIQKVERTHGDFKRLPHSQLQLSTYADFLDNPAVDLTSRNLEADSTNVDGLIASLKRDLELERESHEQTRARANILAAQVANRDAALEAWAQHAASAPVPFSDKPGTSNNGKVKSAVGELSSLVGRDFNEEEILLLFEETNAKNKALEQEIRILSRNVEETRQRASQLLNAPGSSRPLEPSNGNTEDPRNSEPSLLSRPSHLPTDPTSYDQLPMPTVRARHHMAIPQSQTRPPTPPSSRYGPSRRPYQSPVAGSKPHSRSQSGGRPALELSPPVSEAIVARLNDQIHLLSVEIDAFRTERAALTSVIDSQLHRGGEVTVTQEAFQQNASFDSSDMDGDQSFVDGVESDAEPGAEAQPGSNDTGGKDVIIDRAGDITDGGERSMEIATPLFSTLVTFPDSAIDGKDEPPQTAVNGAGGEPGEEIQDDGQIRMIRPRRDVLTSPPIP